MMLFDAFSSSEAIGLGQSVSTAGAEAQTAKFVLGDNARVITDDGRDVVPGSGETGRVAVRGYTPDRLLQGSREVGLHVRHHRRRDVLDPRRLRDGRGRRHAHPARSRLGVHQHRRREGVPRRGRRGAQVATPPCSTPSPSASPTTSSARPSPRWSQLKDGARRSTSRALIDHVKDNLASFKAPKTVVPIDTIGRAAERQGRLQAPEAVRRRRARRAALLIETRP